MKTGTLQSYTVGFILSVLLTLIPYFMVVHDLLDGWALGLSIVAFAIAQLLVQLVFFLHLGRGSDARWNVTVFLFMLLVVLIVVVGSIWIMNNLHYNMTAPEFDEYMRAQGQKGF